MQKGMAIIGSLCCVVPVCRANAAPPAWVNDGDTNAMERVLGSVPRGNRWGSCAPLEVLVRTKTVNGAQQSIKWCAPFPLAVCTVG